MSIEEKTKHKTYLPTHRKGMQQLHKASKTYLEVWISTSTYSWTTWDVAAECNLIKSNLWIASRQNGDMVSTTKSKLLNKTLNPSPILQ